MEDKDFELSEGIIKDLRAVMAKYEGLKYAFVCDNGEMLFMFKETFFNILVGKKLGSKPEYEIMAKLDQYITANYKNPNWYEPEFPSFCGGKKLFD